MNRLHRLLGELVPGHHKRDPSALQAKAILDRVHPRDVAGKTRRRIVAEAVADLAGVDKKLKKMNAELTTTVQDRRSRLMEIQGIGPVGAARILADVGDVARFADRMNDLDRDKRRRTLEGDETAPLTQRGTSSALPLAANPSRGKAAPTLAPKQELANYLGRGSSQVLCNAFPNVVRSIRRDQAIAIGADRPPMGQGNGPDELVRLVPDRLHDVPPDGAGIGAQGAPLGCIVRSTVARWADIEATAVGLHPCSLAHAQAQRARSSA